MSKRDKKPDNGAPVRSTDKRIGRPVKRPLPERSAMVAEDQRIVSTAGICGGSPRVRGTRVPVWVLERCRRRGDNVATVLEDFPSLAEADIRAAWDYAEAHPRAIERQIRENEEF